MEKFKIYLLKFLLVAGILFLENKTYGAWISGGDLTWTALGKDSFLIQLNLYIDCNSSNPPPASITVKCVSTGVTITTLTISNPTPVDITNVCANSCTKCQSIICSYPYGVNKYSYTKLLVINSTSCCELSLQYSVCCRTSSLTTGGADESFFLTAMLNRCYAADNSSPQFNSDPVSIICVGEDVTLDFGAKDSDKDSNGKPRDTLYYELTKPMTSATGYITYSGQYSYDKPLFFWGFPTANLPSPRGFNLDKETGIITFKSMKAEQGIVAIKIHEFRKINGQYVKIGEVTRDTRIIITSCPTNATPVLSGPYYKEVCAGDTITFTIKATDVNTQDTVTIEWSNNISGASWTSNNGLVREPTGIFKWVPSIDNISAIPYVFYVTASDNFCPLNASLTKSYQILVKPGPKIVTYKDSISQCNFHHFSINEAMPSFTYRWSFGNSNQVKMSGDKVTYYCDRNGNIPFTLEVSSMGCDTTTYFDSVKNGQFLTISPISDYVLCYNDSALIEPIISNNSGKTSFYWNTGDTLNKLTFKAVKDSVIILQVSDTAGCLALDTINFKVNPLTNIELDEHLLICGNSSVEISPKFTGGSYQISDISFFDSTNQLIAKGKNHITVTDSGKYKCVVINDYQCPTTAFTNVHKHPEVIANAQNKLICPQENTTLQAMPTGSKTPAVIYQWYNTENGNLIGTQQQLNLTTEKNLLLKLVVKEFAFSKVCDDSMNVKVSVKKPAIQLNLPDYLCKYDSLIDIRNFIDTALGTISSSQPNIVNQFFYHPSSVTGNSDSLIFTLTDYQTGCTFEKKNKVNLLQLPIINILTQYGKYEFCPGYGNIAIIASPTGGKYGGKWYGPIEPGNYFNANRPFGTYQLVYEYRDNDGCLNRDTMNLKVANPEINIDKTNSYICSGQVYQANASYHYASRMKWIIPDSSDGFLQNSVYQTTNVYYPGPGDRNRHGFWLKAMTNDPFCVNNYDSVFVYIAAVPKASFTSNVTNGAPPLEVTFSDLSAIDYDKISEYLWNFGDGNSSTLRNPVHTYLDTGYFDVSLKITSDYGCQDSVVKKKMISVYVVSVPENTLYKPRVYPNPSHDKIMIETKGIEIEKAELTNILGIKIREYNFIRQPNFEIERGKLPPGAYLLKIFDTEGNTSVFNIIFH